MIKVAGYCRVSTDKEDQISSFEAQQRYFREYIQSHPDWELHEIYADEGITGTSTKKRTQFNRMINDARDGKFQIIITKEVSRFSRNILDTISYTRELRSIGIGVIFATDRINTLEPESEMMLSFLASLAQEESRRTSSRVVWGQTRQMERGVVFGRSLLGYKVSGGTLTIDEEEAEVVRLIFHKYTFDEMGSSEIARFLRCKGYNTYSGNSNWSASSVVKILKNEKYVGDLIQKKTYTPDFLTHKKHSNKGEVPFISIKNHHAPIISHEVWDMAQKKLRENNKHSQTGTGHSNRYVYSGKIKCAECGATYVGRIKCLKNGTKIRRWNCGTAVREGREACGIGRLVRDDDAMQMLKTAVKSLTMDYNAVIDNVTKLSLDAICAEECGTEEASRRIKVQIEQVQRKKEAMMDSCFSGKISMSDMQIMRQKYDLQIEELSKRQKEAEALGRENQDLETRKMNVRSEVSAILDGTAENEVFYKRVLNRLTVFKDRHLELQLNLLPQIFWFSE